MLRVLLWCAAVVQSFRFDARQRCTVQRHAAASGASNAADAATPAATPAAAPHTRRKRYAGRYPRHFGDRYKEHSGDEATVKRVLEKGGTPAGSHVPIMVK